MLLLGYLKAVGVPCHVLVPPFQSVSQKLVQHPFQCLSAFVSSCNRTISLINVNDELNVKVEHDRDNRDWNRYAGMPGQTEEKAERGIKMTSVISLKVTQQGNEQCHLQNRQHIKSHDGLLQTAQSRVNAGILLHWRMRLGYL